MALFTAIICRYFHSEPLIFMATTDCVHNASSWVPNLLLPWEKKSFNSHFDVCLEHNPPAGLLLVVLLMLWRIYNREGGKSHWRSSRIWRRNTNQTTRIVIVSIQISLRVPPRRLRGFMVESIFQ